MERGLQARDVEKSALFRLAPEVRLPRLWRPPDGWRARLHEIRARLSQPDDPLAARIRELQTVRRHSGVLAMPPSLRRARREFRDLFPGLAGAELLDAIVTNREVNPTRQAGHPPLRSTPLYSASGWPDGFALVDIFTISPPHFAAQTPRPGRKNRLADRATWSTAVAESALELLRGDPPVRLPLTYAEAAAELGLKPKEFSDLLRRLRRDHGVGIPSAAEQKRRVRVLHACLFPKGDETLPSVPIPRQNLTRRTALHEDVLAAAGQLRRAFALPKHLRERGARVEDFATVPANQVLFDEPA
jgi:hypothetical protein